MKNILPGVVALLSIGVFAAFSLHRPNTTTTSPGTEEEFQALLKQFPLAPLPYEISANTLKDNIMASLRLDDEYDPLAADKDVVTPAPTVLEDVVSPFPKSLEDPKGFIPGSRSSKMSRVPLYNTPISRVETDQYVGLIYNQTRGYSQLYNAYWMAMFDKRGNLISSNLIASTSRSIINSVRIDEQLIAHSESYKIHWKNDLNQNGTLGNEITGLGRDSATEIDLKQATEVPQKKKSKPAKKQAPAVQQSGAK